MLVVGHTKTIRISSWEPGFRYSSRATQVFSGAAVSGPAIVDRILVCHTHSSEHVPEGWTERPYTQGAFL